MNNWIYILCMAAVTFLIRVIPLTLIRKPIKNTFLRSFLYYVPYVTLAVMTFPAIVDATGYPLAGLIAFFVSIGLAYIGKGLFFVSVSACVTVFILERIFDIFLK
jgi:branched-subunit amino acid transport protein